MGAGWDNTAYLVNGEWVFRFPRRTIAVAAARNRRARAAGAGAASAVSHPAPRVVRPARLPRLQVAVPRLSPSRGTRGQRRGPGRARARRAGRAAGALPPRAARRAAGRGAGVGRAARRVRLSRRRRGSSGWCVRRSPNSWLAAPSTTPRRGSRSSKRASPCCRSTGPLARRARRLLLAPHAGGRRPAAWPA